MKKTNVSSKNILIVEDDLYFGKLLAEIVEDFGYKATQVQTVQSALHAIKIDPFALLIIDAMLPNSPKESGISEAETRGGFQAGVALLRKLRKDAVDIPAILITGYPNREVQDWCRASGVTYLVKPCERQNIIENLKGLLGAVKRVRAPSCFIVHGHDHKLLEEISNFIIDNLKFPKPVILKDEAGKGRTIIENLENVAPKIDIVFVLITPDDKFCDPSDSDEIKLQARQNVIFELGLFFGYLGRLSGKIILLHQGPIDLPSDISGITYIDVSRGLAVVEKRIKKELSYWLD
jgi:predicted nucleotide-binding protein